MVSQQVHVAISQATKKGMPILDVWRYVKLYRGQHLGTKIMMAAENGIRRDGFKTCPYQRKGTGKSILRIPWL